MVSTAHKPITHLPVLSLACAKVFSDTHFPNIIVLLHNATLQDMWVNLHTHLLDSKASVIIESGEELNEAHSDSLHPIQSDLKMQCI